MYVLCACRTVDWIYFFRYRIDTFIVSFSTLNCSTLLPMKWTKYTTWSTSNGKEFNIWSIYWWQPYVRRKSGKSILCIEIPAFFRKIYIETSSVYRWLSKSQLQIPVCSACILWYFISINKFSTYPKPKAMSTKPSLILIFYSNNMMLAATTGTPSTE